MLSVTTGILESVSAFDPDAQVYFTGTGIADSVVKGHYNTFVLSAKANGYYSKLKVFRPYLTSDATINSYNAVNLASHQLSYSGGVTHSATTGMTGNGTDGYASYAMDGTPFTMDDGDGLGICVGVWIKSPATSVHSGYILDDLFSLFIVDSNIPESAMGLGSESYITALRLSTGLHLLNTHPTDDTVFQVNGSMVYSSAYTYTDYFNAISLLLYAGIYFSDASITCDILGYGLTDAERASLYTDLLTLQTNLGR